MAITSGFFNSVNGDRKYDARQMSALFSGVINDGVFMSIGTAFTVQAGEGNTVMVGIGKAWFNDIWVLNDAILPMTLPDAEVLLNRYDAIVIEVDDSDAVRDGTIKIVTGTPATSPTKPEMISTLDTHQYPLAYIYRGKGTTAITQSDITSMIGTSSCPYITGILEVMKIDNIVAQWEAQFSDWMTGEKTEFYNWRDTEQTNFYNWRDTEKAKYVAWMAEIHGLVDGETATNLANQIVKIHARIDNLEGQITEHAIIDSDFTKFDTKVD